MSDNSDKEARPTDTKRVYERKERYQALPPLPCSTKKATALLEQWVKDCVVRLSYFNHFPTLEDQKAGNCCLFPQKKLHTLGQCVLFEKFFDGKLNATEILFPKHETTNIYKAAFPRHHYWGKRSYHDGIPLQC